MSIPNVTAQVTPNPDNRSMDINAKPGHTWTRKSGSDAQGSFRTHNITVRDKAGVSHDFAFKIRNQDALTEVIALKAFKSTIKTLSTQETQHLKEHIKAGNTPQVKIVKNKDGEVLGAIPVFPGDDSTDHAAFCYLKDGTKLRFSKDERAWYEKMVGVGTVFCKDYAYTALEIDKIDAEVLKRFKGRDGSYPMWESFQKTQKGDLGYDLAVQHKHTYKKPLAEAAEQFNHTRMDRAKAILSMLEEEDQTAIVAEKEDDADASAQQPKLTISPANPNPPPSSSSGSSSDPQYGDGRAQPVGQYVHRYTDGWYYQSPQVFSDPD